MVTSVSQQEPGPLNKQEGSHVDTRKDHIQFLKPLNRSHTSQTFSFFFVAVNSGKKKEKCSSKP